MPEMPKSHIRNGHELYLRKGHRREPDVRFSLGKNNPPTTGRARPDGKAAGDRQDRCAAKIYFQKRPAIQGIPGDKRWKCRLRVRAAAGESKKGRSHGRTE